MSVGFGFSAGDFIAAIKLVNTLVDALRESGHARSTFRDLIQELYALEDVLIRVKRLDLDEQLKIEELALRQAASQCQRSIDFFWNKVQSLQPHLQSNGTGSMLKDGWAKMKWAVCKQTDVDQFRATIRGHTSSIQMLLSTVQLGTMNLSVKRQEKQRTDLASMMQSLANQVMSDLRDVTSTMSASEEQGKQLLDISTQIVNTNLRVFAMIRDIQTFILNIPNQVQRQQAVEFTDPFNRIKPFHLEFITSEAAFLSVLKHDFVGRGCDVALLEHGNFVIDDIGTGRSVDWKVPWDCRFAPGQRVAMSIMFREGPYRSRTCPGCHTAQDAKYNEEIIWYV